MLTYIGSFIVSYQISSSLSFFDPSSMDVITCAAVPLSRASLCRVNLSSMCRLEPLVEPHQEIEDRLLGTGGAIGCLCRQPVNLNPTILPKYLRTY